MTKEKAIQELKKNREKIAKAQKRESELVEYIREKEKEEAMAILEKFKISPEELGEMLEEHKAENRKLLLKAEERENSLLQVQQNSRCLEADSVDENLEQNTELR